jgi:hypothetical protein
MPKVPTYDNFQVMPGVRQGNVTPSLTPEAAALAGRQSQVIGGAISQAGGELGKIAQAEQEKANRIRVQDAYNQAILQAQDLRKEYGQLKAGDVMKVGNEGRALGDHYYDELNKRIAEIGGELGNPAVREQFDLLAEDLATRFRGDAVAYEAEQSAVYARQVLDTTVVTSFDVIMSDPFKPGVVEQHVSMARDALHERFTAEGLDAAGVEEKTKDVLGKGHTNVIDLLLEQSDPEGAKTYFKRHRTDFNAGDAELMEAKLNKASVGTKVVNTVQDLLAEYPLRGREVPRATMERRLREMVGTDNPELLRAAREELSYQINLHEDQAQDAYRKTFDNVLGKVLSGTPPSEMYSDPAYLALDASDSEKIFQIMKGLNDEDTNNRWNNEYSELVNTQEGRTRLLAMTEEEVNRLINDVGPANLAALRKARTAYQEAPNKLAEANISSTRFNVIAQSMGYEPFAKKPTPEQKAELATLRYRLTTALDEEQRARGRKLTGAEQDEFFRREMSNTVLLRGRPGLFGQGEAYSRAAIMLEPDEVEDILVPLPDMAAIAASLSTKYAQNPLPQFQPTKENIRRVYLKSKGLVDADAE